MHTSLFHIMQEVLENSSSGQGNGKPLGIKMENFRKLNFSLAGFWGRIIT